MIAPTRDGKGLNSNHDKESSIKTAGKVKTTDGRKGKMDVSAKVEDRGALTVEPTTKGGIKMQSHDSVDTHGEGEMKIDGISVESKHDNRKITDIKEKKDPLPNGGTISSSTTEE